MVETVTEDRDRQLELFSEEEQEANTLEAINRIRDKFHGVAVSISQGPQSRKLTNSQKAEALKDSGASTDAITMGKRLFDKRVVSRVPSLRKVRDILARLSDLKNDKMYTLPHPEAGVRLVRAGDANLDRLQLFINKFDSLKQELTEATQTLWEDWDEVKVVAEQELGRYYSDADYSFDVRSEISAEYKLLDIDVPSYLQHNAALYAREEQRVKAELELVKQLKEQEMAEDLFNIADRLAERLTPRRLFDDTHEVLDVVDNYNDAGDKLVRYQPQGTSAKTARREAVVPRNEFSRRVTTDKRPKTFRNKAAEDLVDAMRHAEEILSELKIGDGQVASAFQRLREIIGDQDPAAMSAALRNSEAYREKTQQKFEELSEFIINSVVSAPRRPVLRKRKRMTRGQE
jgi:hypothetical protein